jgi:uncharacterized protein YjbI with pentapeptide repeats
MTGRALSLRRSEKRKTTARARQEILDAHRLWLETATAQGRRADLSGVVRGGLSFWRADLRQIDLHDADLQDANLDHARLSSAMLRGACLSGASLWEADLHGADLKNASLRGANLDHADLRGADLRRTDLTGASLWGAHLEGADLRWVTGLTASQLATAHSDDATLRRQEPTRRAVKERGVRGGPTPARRHGHR